MTNKNKLNEPNMNNISRRSALKYMGISALGVATIFTGISCTKTDKEAIKNGEIVGVTKKKDKVSDAQISLLGFGCMRLPLKNIDDKSSIDEELATKMIDYAYKHGVNYFDTAWFYHQGFSEPFVGKTLKKYPRESLYIATKMPIAPILTTDPNGLVKSEKPLDRIKEILELQLKRLQTNYIDFYFLHSIRSLEQYQTNFIDTGGLDYLLEQKQKGIIKRLGFSFHGPNEELPKVADQYKWDFVMIQANYYDWEKDISNAKFLYDELDKRGIQTIFMEPVRGGMLATLTPDACKVFQDAEPDSSVASWAIRWCASLPNVMTVLSGMSILEHVEDNVKTLTNFKPLTETQYKTIATALSEHRKTEPIPCTICDYCVSPPCPAGIDISAVFAMYNECIAEGNVPELSLMRTSDRGARHQEEFEKQKRIFLAKMNKISKKKQAIRCTSCNECLPKCPQNINITEKMQYISNLIKSLEK